MALKTLQRDAETRFSLEDVFLEDVWDDGDTSAAKLAWVNGWRNLPHIDPEVQRLYEYPQQFAEEIYDRIERELGRRDSNAEASGGSKNRAPPLYRVRGRLWRLIRRRRRFRKYAGPVLRLLRTGQIVAAHKAEPYDRAQLLQGRREGHFLVSYVKLVTKSVTKSVTKPVMKRQADGFCPQEGINCLLAEVLGAGRDARIVGLPLHAAQVLRLMCTDLVIPENVADQASVPPSIEKT